MKLKYAALFLALLVFMAGCVKIQVHEEIKEDGTSDIMFTMDMSNFPQQDGQEVDLCENMDEGEAPLKNLECTSEGMVFTIKGTMDRTATGALTVDDGTYRLDVKKALETLDMDDAGSGNESSGSQMEMPDTDDKQQLQQLKAMGFEYSYTIKMPGEVKEQVGGTIQEDGSVKFDIISMPDEAYVVSETGGLLSCLPFLAGIVAAAAAGLAKLIGA